MATHFAICIKNDGYEASLEVRKLYEVLNDPGAEKIGQVRVIDESGEDYQYPKDFFLPIFLPESIEQVVIRTA